MGDVAANWYPNWVAKNGASYVRKFLVSNQFVVERKYFEIKLEDGRKRRGTRWAVLSKDIAAIEKLNPQWKLGIDTDEEDVGKCIFYMLQLYPLDAPNIIKFGSTERALGARSSEYYVYDPKVLIEAERRLGKECFSVKDVDAVTQRTAEIAPKEI